MNPVAILQPRPPSLNSYWRNRLLPRLPQIHPAQFRREIPFWSDQHRPVSSRQKPIWKIRAASLRPLQGHRKGENQRASA